MSEDEKQLLDHYIPPAWLRSALELSRASPEFDARLDEAAVVALAIAKMRQQRDRTLRFVDLSLAEYVNGIAALSRADLPAVLRWLKVSDLGRLTLENVRGVVQLCQELGMSLREAIAHMRIGYAEGQEFRPFSLVVAQRGPGDRGLEYCEAALAEVETGYPSGVLQELRTLEDAVYSAYRGIE